MSLRSNGSYIGPRPAGPSSSEASGIWDLRTVQRQRSLDAWPDDLDADAAAYIAAVEAADGEALESGVRTAIDTFVSSLKSDGLWEKIKASCILAGARTLNGALTPLVGSAPTNNGFVSGDYSRSAGITGSGTKYLATNRNNNSDAQNDNHNAIFVTAIPGSSERLMGAGAGDTGANLISTGSNVVVNFRNRAIGASQSGTSVAADTLLGTSRSASGSFSARIGGATETYNVTSQTPYSATVNVFRSGSSSFVYTTARLSFYSLGESLDLEQLESHVDTLMAAIAAAV